VEASNKLVSEIKYITKAAGQSVQPWSTGEVARWPFGLVWWIMVALCVPISPAGTMNQ
jgi:hypothetical protein